MDNLINSLNQLRRDYKKDKFSEKTALSDPYKQFEIWLGLAVEIGMYDPNAMVFASSDKAGNTSARVVLLKNYDNRGLVFFTNYESHKANDILENPKATLLFYWDKLERQIRFSGHVEKVTEEESNAYFQTREYTSKIGAWASLQSKKLTNRFTLLRRVAGYMAKYPVNVPLPPYWGGYRLMPDTIEFWQGRESRLHDRIQYMKNGDKWDIIRLYP